VEANHSLTRGRISSRRDLPQNVASIFSNESLDSVSVEVSLLVGFSWELMNVFEVVRTDFEAEGTVIREDDPLLAGGAPFFFGRPLFFPPFSGEDFFLGLFLIRVENTDSSIDFASTVRLISWKCAVISSLSSSGSSWRTPSSIWEKDMSEILLLSDSTMVFFLLG